MMAATSTGDVGAAAAAAAGADCAGAEAGCAGAGAGVTAADDEWPKIAEMMSPKMLIVVPPKLKEANMLRGASMCPTSRIDKAERLPDGFLCPTHAA
jgi:hypothetical protein